jgi:hypothetical protein
MTHLLRRAVAEIERLPDDEQDAVAERILSDLADERAWTQRFGSTSEKQWASLAEMARRDIASGGTVPIEDAFPVRVNEE